MAELFNFLSFKREKEEEKRVMEVSKSSIWKLKKTKKT